MIEAIKLTKKFDHRGIAGLHGINLKVNKGQILALMGPNGSGKSTLLNILAGKLTPDSGVITKPGHLFNLDTAEVINVQKFLISKVTHVIDEEKKIQLARDLADIFEFTFQLRQNLNELSAGQKQKVLMAAELINHPESILLDEPFTHLDPYTRQDILQALFTYIKQRDITVIWVTHETDEAMKYADLVALMNFGKLEQIATPEEITFAPRSLFVAQFLGYKNFVSVKKVNGLWQTPWGNWECSQFPEKDEAIMVIPHQAWKTNNDYPIEVKKTYIQQQQWELTIFFKERPYQVRLSTYPKNPSLCPIFEECFLVPQ